MRTGAIPNISPTVNDRILRIWQAVRKIPRGRVSTYGAVARAAGIPGRYRLVGSALSRLPDGAEVPWHRVLSAGGRISLPERGGAAERQRRRLAEEGILLTRGRVDLRAHGWPRSAFR